MTDKPKDKKKKSESKAKADSAQQAEPVQAVAKPYKKVLEKKTVRRDKAPLWLVSFTDIMALMLTFFVLLYSMSSPQLEKWEEFTSALTVGFSKFKSPKNFTGQQEDINIDRLDYRKALSLDYLESLINDTIAKEASLQNIRIFNQNDRLILSLPVDLLFETGRADVGTQGKRALFNVGGPLSRIRNRIEVIGHADPTPMNESAEGYQSNWELSLARATQVSSILADVGYRKNIVVRGMSSTRYDELPESLGAAERLDFARRVDIVIMRDDGNRRMVFQ